MTTCCVLREMTGPHGGFFSATDADSEGEEGKYFVWSPDEIAAVLGPEEAAVFGGFFGATQDGNFEGKNILNISKTAAAFAAEQGMPLDHLLDIIRRGKTALRLVREQRVPPLLDDKALASWNGLMLRAFAEAGAALDRHDYLDAAIKNAAFLTTTMQPDGQLLRTYRAGEARLPGFLEDYSFVADGLLALYESTFDQQWLDAATGLADSMIELFWDEPAGAFYDTGPNHEELVVRPRGRLRQRPALRQLRGVRPAAPAGGNHRQRRVPGEGGAIPADPRRTDGAGASGNRTVVGGIGLPRLDTQGDRHRRPAGRPGHGPVVEHRFRQLPGQPRGGRRFGAGQRVRPPSPGRPRHGRRRSHRLRLRELRLPVAGNRPRSAGGATQRLTL